MAIALCNGLSRPDHCALLKQYRLKENEEIGAKKRGNREREMCELRVKVDNLLAVVNAAMHGDLTHRIEVDGDDAIDHLANGLQKMLAELARHHGPNRPPRRGVQ